MKIILQLISFGPIEFNSNIDKYDNYTFYIKISNIQTIVFVNIFMTNKLYR